MKILTVVAELFHADVHTYVMKLIIVFRNFAKASKKSEQPIDCRKITANQLTIYKYISALPTINRAMPADNESWRSQNENMD